MDGGFLEKIKAMLMGGGAPTAPSPATSEAPPWMDPTLAPPPRPMPPQGPVGGPPAAAPQDDIGMQIQQLLKQREIAKSFVPESSWNR